MIPKVDPKACIARSFGAPYLRNRRNLDGLWYRRSDCRFARGVTFAEWRFVGHKCAAGHWQSFVTYAHSCGSQPAAADELYADDQ